MTNQAAIVRTVSMYLTDWEVADELADRLFDGNTSQALRYIVRQWAAQDGRLRANIETVFDTNAAEAT